MMRIPSTSGILNSFSVEYLVSTLGGIVHFAASIAFFLPLDFLIGSLRPPAPSADTIGVPHPAPLSPQPVDGLAALDDHPAAADEYGVDSG
jgi:hypothetical protein